ncbi:ribonuclease H-like domain-containing protein [Tanacetum coccineum]
MHDPWEPHLAALKCILRYARGTVDHGLQLHVSSTSHLTAYTDDNWVGCPVTCRSASGYCAYLGDNLLSCSAKRKVTLSRSSAEAEYRDMLVYCDNVSVVYFFTNPAEHKRTKNLEIDIHFVRDFVACRQVRVLHAPTRFQYEDIFTKGLTSA